MRESASKRLTAEELASLPGHERFELVAGRLRVSEPPGGLHGMVAVRIASLLDAHVRANSLGTVLVETGYIVRRRPDTVRGPDVSFVSRTRFDPRDIPAAFVSAAPDLAVEILSADDRRSEIEEKIAEYLQGGSGLVWVVDPVARVVVVHRPGRPAERLAVMNELDGSDTIPGFRCSVGKLFE